jgi:hypothetical protein
MVSTSRYALPLAMLMVLLVHVMPAHAAVVASVDRAEVELNESFTLKVTVDTSIDIEPDVSRVEQDFYISARTQLSNTTIVNGQISRSRTWNYVLMARREGDLVIPPVTIGNEQSDPVPITVRPPSSAAPGEADIFITAEIDSTESYVQAQLLYRVKVYRAVATRQPRLSDPDISGVDVLVEVAGEERSYEALLDGKSYNVVERVYALFPQESGELSIAPMMFEARVLRDGRITGRKVYQSEARNLTIRPIPPPPADYPNAAWLPARSVELAEEWSREPGELPAGEPITRRLSITALGQLSTQLPVLEPVPPDGVRIYPDKPELSVAAVTGGILAERRDQYAIIGTGPGTVELPAVELPWWDLDAGEWKVATLPARTLEILPGAAGTEPLPEPEPAVQPAVTETVVVQSEFWRRIAEGLAVLWLLTACGWWWSRRAPRERAVEPPAVPLHRQQTRCLKQARAAARANDTSGVKDALLEWGRLEWPHDPPRSLGRLATRLDAPLSDELERLNACTYGREGRSTWDGANLAKALRSVSTIPQEPAPSVGDGLPPLMPAGR